MYLFVSTSQHSTLICVALCVYVSVVWGRVVSGNPGLCVVKMSAASDINSQQYSELHFVLPVNFNCIHYNVCVFVCECVGIMCVL